MCYIILARSIKRGFKTGVNLLRQVCTFVLSPFFMQKCDGIRHNYYLIQTERTVNFMTKNEVIELVKSGRLRGFLPPEMAQYEVNVEQMGSYTGIVLVNPEQKALHTRCLILTGQWKDCSLLIQRKKWQNYLQEA